MKILFLCHRLITFILNDILELERHGNDVTIYSIHKDTKILNKIVLPILKSNHLANKLFVNLTNYSCHLNRFFDLFLCIIHDLVFSPFRTLKSFYLLFTIFDNIKEFVFCYLDTRPLLSMHFDVIHCPFSTPDSIKQVYFLSKLLKTPYTLSFRAHDLHIVNAFEESLSQKSIIQNASKIFTISEYNKSILDSRLSVNYNIEIIHAGVDTDFFSPIPQNQKLLNSIISICNFHEPKGIIFLLKALGILQNRRLDFHYTLIGEGPDEPIYREIIQKEKIKNITIKNYLSNVGVRDELSKSEIFILPCVPGEDGLRDILPNVIKEAMSMELPIITSDISGIRELVDDLKSGILVPPKDPTAIAGAIEMLLPQKQLIKQMGAFGRNKIINNFNVHNEVAKLSSLLDKSSHNNKFI